jgi:GrpB-like predicted nucleotidyltransferase (UPF0157 family)
MVELVDYKERWPADFRQIGTGLRNALDSMAIRIDHIGSTSVPGLRAKDVLDIQVTVEAIDRVVEARVLAAGFRQPPGVWRDHRPPDAVGPDDDWRKLFFNEPLGGRRINLHVRELGRPNQRYPLLFRDFLIAHPPMAAAYGELKVRLAACLREDDDYPDVKDPAADLIYLAAGSWAELSSWHPGASDA